MAVYLELILFGLIAFHIWVRYRRMGRVVDKIPGPPALPFFGNMLSIATNDRHKLWNIIRNLAREYRIIRLWFFTRVWVGIRDPDDLQIVLTSKVNLNKRALYECSLKFTQSGLLTSNREIWAHRRKIVNTGFHFNIIKKYVEITGEHAELFIKKIKSYGDETTLDVIPLCSDLMLKIICEAAFGVNLNKLDPKAVEEYSESLHVIYNTIVYRVTRPYITEWMMNFLPLGWKMNRAIKKLHSFSDKIIQERREYYENNTDSRSYQSFVDDIDTDIEDMQNGRKRRMVMLDVLLSAERDGLIDANGVREEVDIFTIAGHDTTAVTMAFTLMLFAEHPEIQDRARKEVIKIFSEKGGNLTITETQKFEYLDRCLKEALRLYPPFSIYARYLDEDVQLKNYLIPAGVDVLFFTFDTHRDHRYWPDPTKFDPDRFLPENMKKRHPYAYLPFSAGPRNCIGQKFAMNELKSVVAHVLYNFYLEPVDRLADMKLVTSVTTIPNHPVRVKFITRNM